MRQNHSTELIIVCVRCQQQKKLNEMVPDKRSPRGHQGYCKECDRLAKKQIRTNRTWPERKASNINVLTCKRTGKSPGFTAADIENLWRKYKGRCYYCGRQVHRDGERSDPLAFNLDHVIPGIHDDITNLVISCSRCNGLKQDNTIATFKNFIEKIESHLASYPHLAAEPEEAI